MFSDDSADKDRMLSPEQEMRTFPRVEAATLVRIRGEAGPELTAVVEDTSLTGMKVSVNTEFEAGERVRIRSARWTRDGVVRHCSLREQDAHFAIGIELD